MSIYTQVVKYHRYCKAHAIQLKCIYLTQDELDQLRAELPFIRDLVDGVQIIIKEKQA